MANYEVPSWIGRDQNPAGRFLDAYRTSASIAETQARLDAEQEQNRMAAQAAKEQHQQNFLQQQQRIAVEKAYNDQRIDIDKQKLDAAAKVNLERGQDAARAFLEKQRHDMATEANSAVAMRRGINASGVIFHPTEIDPATGYLRALTPMKAGAVKLTGDDAIDAKKLDLDISLWQKKRAAEGNADTAKAQDAEIERLINLRKAIGKPPPAASPMEPATAQNLMQMMSRPPGFTPDLLQGAGLNAGNAAPPDASAAPQAALPTTAAPRAQPSMLPNVGDVINGHKFKGGDPSDKDNWEPITNEGP